MRNYTRAYLKERPLFLSLIRGREAKLFRDKFPLERPILDFGCGDGFFAKIIFGDFGKIETGIDVDRKILNKAKETQIYKKVIYYKGYKLPFPDKSFSSVVSNCVLEHVNDLEKNLKEIRRVLIPGGKFICTVMTCEWEKYLLGNVIPGGIYKKWMRTKQIHNYLLSKRQWDFKFTDAKFEIETVEGYLDRKASRWLDFLHYVSVSSLVSYKLFGKWVLFPQKYDILRADRIVERLGKNGNVPVRKSAALFYVLKR